MTLKRLLSTGLAAAGLCSWVQPPASAAVVTADADTFVQRSNIQSGNTTTTPNTAGFFSIRDSATGGNNRAGAIRFLPAAGDVGTSDGSSLTITFNSVGTSLGAGEDIRFDLFGVLDGAVEDDLDESTYSPAIAQAIDASGNNIRETSIFNGTDPALRVLDSITLTANPSVDDTLTFSGANFDNFISSVTTNPADPDLAFVLTVDASQAEFEVKFDSINLAGGAAPVLDVNIAAIPEPSTAALVGFGLIGVAVRRRRRR